MFRYVIEQENRMLGPMGVKIISALRVLTPNEIDTYASEKGKARTRGVVAAKAAGAEDLSLNLNEGSVHQEQNKKKTSDGDEDAKIIPLNEEAKESLKKKASENESTSSDTDEVVEARSTIEEEIEVDHSSIEADGDEDLESVGILSKSKIAAIKKAKAEAKKKKQDSTTVFLIKEREKLRKSKEVVRGQGAINSYKGLSTSESYDVEVDIDDPDKELPDGAKGILINKRYY